MAFHVLPPLRRIAGREGASIAVAGLAGWPGAVASVRGEAKQDEKCQGDGNHSVCSGSGAGACPVAG